MEAKELGALLRQYLDGGREGAVEELISRTRPRLLAAARRIGAPQDAEDAVQTAYLALVRQREPPDAPVLPWLLRAVIRIAYRRKAIERRQHALAGKLEQPREEPSAAAAAMSAEERAKVRAQIDLLPERYRDVLVLHDLEGLSTPEIAALQEVPDATVRTRLRRGRELLRGPLGPVWKCGLLALPWLVHDAAAAGGGLVVKKKAVLAGAILLLSLAGGVAVVSSGGARTSGSRSATQARPGRGSEPQPQPGPADRATEPAPETPSVTGVVLDPLGRAVSGAFVRIDVQDPEARPRPFRALLEGDAAEPGPRTGPDGSFRVALREDASPQALVVDAKGLSPARVAGVRPNEHVVVKLERAPSISGAVRDLSGRPVVGARVAWWLFYDGTRVERRGVSDGDGLYRIDDLPSPRSWPIDGFACSVAVRADGFAPVVTEGPMLRLGREEDLKFDVWLTRGSAIEGRVLDVGTREPVPGASVALHGLVSGGYVTYEEAVADEHGAFVLRSFPVDGFHEAGQKVGDVRHVGFIRAEAAGFSPSTVDVPTVESGRSLALEVFCWRAATVRGRVLDGEGRPVAGASVSGFRNLKPRPSYLDGGGSSPWAKTDGSGAFAWTDIPALKREASSMRVYAHREGWPVKEAIVEVRAGETTVVEDFVFDGPPPPSVIAEVVDEWGAPVAGAKVGVHPAAGTPTGPDGRARLFLDAVRECRLAAYSERSSACLSAPFLPSAEDPPVVRVVLDATHSVEGTVEDADGAPVRAATVSAWRGKEPLAHGRADAMGRFRLERLPAGLVDLTAMEGGREARTTAVPVDTTSAVVVLPLAEKLMTAAVEGAVRDAVTGEPVLRFTAMLKGPTWLKAERTAPGRFRFDAVPEGRWTLVVAAIGYAQHAEPLDVAASLPPGPLSIDLRGGAKVAGRIERADVQLTGATLALFDERGVAWPAHLSASTGQYRADNVRPGRYWPVVHGTGIVAPLGPGELVVPEGLAEVRFDFAIVAAGTLAILHAGKAERVEVADTEGRTVWLRLDPSGDLRVNLPGGGYTVNGRRAEVAVGRVTEVDLGR